MMDSQEEGGSLFDLDSHELQDFILDMFLRFDVDESGYLDRREFKRLMQSSELGLSKKEVGHVP
jgi:Ca2+-binding EF-hand superfamily protein